MASVLPSHDRTDRLRIKIQLEKIVIGFQKSSLVEKIALRDSPR